MNAVFENVLVARHACQIGICGNCGSDQCLVLFVTFLGSVLSSFCGVAGHIVLLGGHCHWVCVLCCARRLFTWRTSVFGWVEHVKWYSHECQDPKLSQENIALFKQHITQEGVQLYCITALVWLGRRHEAADNNSSTTVQQYNHTTTSVILLLYNSSTSAFY